MQKIFIIFFCILFKSIASSAQTWEIEANGGATGYVGDLNPIKIYKLTDPAYGFAIKRNFSGTWSAGLNILQGKIQASDADSDNAWQRKRNLSFFSPITEVAAIVEFNFLTYLPGIRYTIEHHRITPFLFTGVGGVLFSPRAMYNGEEYQLASSQTEGVAYPLYALSIPYGVGVKYNPKGNWTFLFKIGYRTAFTDYLDDVSDRYSSSQANSMSAIFRDRSGEIDGGNNIGVVGYQRGDFRKKDTYMFIGFGISYNLVSSKCFSFKE